jgi:hypothetical protein
MIPESLKDDKLDLLSLFGSVEVLKMMNTFFAELSLYKPQIQLFKSIKNEEIDCSFFAMNLPKEGSNELLNVIIHEYTLPFTAEFVVYCSLNQQVKVNDTFKEDEILHYEAYENTIYILNRLRTEKVLFVAPRNILMLRVIQRLDENRYLDMNQTVDVTCLMQHWKVKQIFESVKENFATTFISGSYIENVGGVCRTSSFVRSDFKTTVKMTFFKIFLNKNFEATMNNTVRNLDSVYSSEPWKHDADHRWFKGGIDTAVDTSFLRRTANAKFSQPSSLKSSSNPNDVIDAHSTVHSPALASY